MASRAYPTPAPASRRRLPASPATFSPALGKTPPRRALVPADRDRIEALVWTLIAWLDAHDAPLVELEPDHDGEDGGDAELSEPTESLVHLCDRLGFYGRNTASTASRGGSIG